MVKSGIYVESAAVVKKPTVKRIPKYKSRIKVLDNMALQGVCSCGWVGNALVQSSGLDKALAATQSEIQTHKHILKAKKVK